MEIEEQLIYECKQTIAKGVTHILLARRSNLRAISWYCIQIANHNGNLKKAATLMAKIKSSSFSDQIDVPLLQKALKQKQQSASPRRLDPDLVPDNSYFTPDYQVIVPDFSDLRACKQFIDDFKEKPITTMPRLQRALKRFACLFGISYTKGLFYPMELLQILQEWVSSNFGMVEIELQINVLRMVIGQLDSTRVVTHLLMVEHFCPAAKDFPFLQLFMNTILVQIEITSTLALK